MKPIQELQIPKLPSKHYIGSVAIYTDQDGNIDPEMLMREIKAQFKAFVKCVNAQQQSRTDYALQKRVYEHARGLRPTELVELLVKPEEAPEQKAKPARAEE